MYQMDSLQPGQNMSKAAYNADLQMIENFESFKKRNNPEVIRCQKELMNTASSENTILSIILPAIDSGSIYKENICHLKISQKIL